MYLPIIAYLFAALTEDLAPFVQNKFISVLCGKAILSVDWGRVRLSVLTLPFLSISNLSSIMDPAANTLGRKDHMVTIEPFTFHFLHGGARWDLKLNHNLNDCGTNHMCLVII